MALQLAGSLRARKLDAWPKGKAANALIIGQPRVAASHDFLSVGSSVENQNRLYAAGSDHRGIMNTRLLLQHAFHSLGENVETLGGHDHFFLAAENGQFSVVLQLADVAGMKPAVFEGARGLFGMLEVARGHVVAAHQDLAIGCDLHFHAADRFAYAPLAR